jgi:CysZ protein
MFASIVKAATLFFDSSFAGVLLRAAFFTLLLFLAGLAGAELLIAGLPEPANPTIRHALELLAPVLFLFLLGVLGPPVAALFGTFFLDRVAGRIEARDYPGAPALAARFWPALKAGLRLTGLVLGADLLLLPLDIGLPGLGEILSLIANGWLLGREYFELAALRHLDLAAADRLRLRNSGAIWASGTLIALTSMIPGIDLIAPLFGTALMVHLFHRAAGTKAKA